LRELNRPLELMAAMVSEGFGLLDFGGGADRPRLLYANAALMRMIGVEQEGAGAGLQAFFQRLRPDWPQLCLRALDTGSPVQVEVADPAREWWCEVHLGPGGPGELTVLAVDRTERRRAARAQAETFAELHHRVKNSLANAGALLKLQAMEEPSADVGDRLLRAADRILAISNLHEVLYRGDDWEMIDIGAYVRDFCERLGRSLTAEGRIRLEVDAQPELWLPFDHAASLGVVLNELVTNALKHAYPPPAAGVVRVELRQADEHMTLRVIDFGRGLDGPPERAGSLGMRLVRSLARQLHAEVGIGRLSPGAVFELTMPIPSSPLVAGRRMQRLL
jgi:two-component sensor histidine kinase